jgi:hypothetical protein
MDRILREIKPGTEIPKPAALFPFRFQGKGERRGQRTVVYTIPNHKDPTRPSKKAVTESELDYAHRQLLSAGRLTREWFKKHLPDCAKQGCNFTTVGGLFVLLGEAEYQERGVYRHVVARVK